MDEVPALRQQLSDISEQLTAASLEVARLNSEVWRWTAIVHQQAGQIASLNQALGAASESSDDGNKFRRLRALIVKELHPDHAPPDSVDRAIRAEVFKVIWPKVEAITQG